MPHETPTVVFDFDLTLTNWDTADRFFRWLLRRDAWRLALVVSVVPVLAPLLASQRTRKWPVRVAIWIATLGRSDACLQALVREHAQQVETGSPPVFLHEGLEQLRSHLDQGHRVVIATGCLEVLARALLERAGFGHVPLVGSSLRPHWGGMASHEHCFGPNKIPMLARRGFTAPFAIAYTDHQCDLPVLALSRARFLVNPKPAAIRAIERELAGDATVLAWR